MLTRTVTSVNAYLPYADSRYELCAVPLWPDGSSAGNDCGPGPGAGGGSVSYASGQSVYPRIKTTTNNPGTAQSRGKYWTP